MKYTCKHMKPKTNRMKVKIHDRHMNGERELTCNHVEHVCLTWHKDSRSLSNDYYFRRKWQYVKRVPLKKLKRSTIEQSSFWILALWNNCSKFEHWKPLHDACPLNISSKNLIYQQHQIFFMTDFFKLHR